ncbi:hypothetical protein JG688_00011320, partial [Phytophthora aleatoria]
SSPFSSPSSTGWDDEDELLLGASIRASKTRDEVKESVINARADTEPGQEEEDLSKEMTTDAHNGMYWALLGLYKHVDVLKWFRDEGETQFPTVALLARIHLGKISSSAFQERVFSTGGIVMSPRRTRTDSIRAEKQLLLRHSRDEIVKMKQDARMEADS